MSINFHISRKRIPSRKRLETPVLAWDGLLMEGRGNPMLGKLNKFHAFFMHIGQHIKEVMQQQGVSATRLAKDICCARTHVHRIFRKDNIDIALLERISTALDYDFFRDLSDEFRGKV